MKNRKVDKLTITGFSAMLVMMFLTGILPLFMFHRLALSAKKIYYHPFTVSNAVRSINRETTNIQSTIKDILNKKEKENFENDVRKIRNGEYEISDNISEIQQYYLGDKKDIEDIKEYLENFKSDTYKIISFKLSGDSKNAIKTFRKNSALITKLDVKLSKILNFAYGKAYEFYKLSTEDRKTSFTVIILMLSVLLSFAILIGVYILLNLRKSQIEINQYMYLIDQHINILKINSKTKVATETTNSLLRLLKLTKNQVLGNNLSEILLKDNDERVNSNLNRIIETGSEWTGYVRRFVNETDEQWLEVNIQPERDKNLNLNSFSIIMSDATYEKKVEKMSLTDELTGIYNRRNFNYKLLNLIRIAGRYKTCITLAIVDLDHFKKYNDKYGHPAGDELLFKIANEMRKLMHRTGDELFRIGGEEFAIIFSNLNKEESKSFLERIRDKIEKLNMIHAGNSAGNYVTISIGAKVCIAGSQISPEYLYDEADKALYKAKETRNTVVVR